MISKIPNEDIISQQINTVDFLNLSDKIPAGIENNNGEIEAIDVEIKKT